MVRTSHHFRATRCLDVERFGMDGGIGNRKSRAAEADGLSSRIFE